MVYNLLELRFADDILIFAQSRVEAGNLLDALVKQLDRVGLLVNPAKTMVITNEAPPPQTITTTAGVNLKVLPRDGGLKWLSSMLTSCGSKLHDVDLQYHLQQASKIFHMNRWILQDRNVSLTKRLRYFESVASLVACFAGGHRNRQLERLDTHFRKLCRSIVGPPPGTAWTLEWHEILHQWNVRVNIFIDRANIKTWSRICCLNYWRLAQHVAMLSPERWVRRILRWCPAGTYRIVLQMQRLGAMDGCCHESEPVGSTLRILHSNLQYIECLDSPLCSIFVEQLDTFCACALKGPANIGVQVWL